MVSWFIPTDAGESQHGGGLIFASASWSLVDGGMVGGPIAWCKTPHAHDEHSGSGLNPIRVDVYLRLTSTRHSIRGISSTMWMRRLRVLG